MKGRKSEAVEEQKRRDLEGRKEVRGREREGGRREVEVVLFLWAVDHRRSVR